MAALGGAAALPLTVRAQQYTQVIGLLNSCAPDASANLMQSLRKGLSETGYVEE
jgi:hypothetical protein